MTGNELLKGLMSFVSQHSETNKTNDCQPSKFSCPCGDHKISHFLIAVALFAVVIVLPLWFMRSGKDR